jgi:hypothetical protein
MAVYTTRATSTPLNVYPSEVHTCGHISNEATLNISVDPQTPVFSYDTQYSRLTPSKGTKSHNVRV